MRFHSHLFFLLPLALLSGCRPAVAPLNVPGEIFIRQRVKDIPAFREAFLGQRQQLKDIGLSAYSLHRDTTDSRILILTLKCSNLAKALTFVQSPEFMAEMGKGGAKLPVIWYGADATDRKYENQGKMAGGIVIARNVVRSYPFWKACFDSEGPHHHPGRGYVPSRLSIHFLEGNPGVAIVVHEASDVTQAPAFMTSDRMNGEMESMGVVGLEIWYGFNLEEGLL